MYNGQIPGHPAGNGITGQSVPNGQIPFNFPVRQSVYMNSGSASASGAGPGSASASQINGEVSTRTGSVNAPAAGAATGPAGSYYPMQFNGPLPGQQQQQQQQQQQRKQGQQTQPQGYGVQSPFDSSISPGKTGFPQGYLNTQQNGNQLNNSQTSIMGMAPPQSQPQQQQQQQHLHNIQLQTQQNIPIQSQDRAHSSHLATQHIQPPQSTQSMESMTSSIANQPQRSQKTGMGRRLTPGASHTTVAGSVPPHASASAPPHSGPMATPNPGLAQVPGNIPVPHILGPAGIIPSQVPSTYPYPLRKYLSNLAILRAHEIINLLNVSNDKLNDMKYWVKIMSELFTPYGLFRYSRKQQDDIRQFEFTAVVIPSVMRAFGSSGVAKLEIVPHQLRAQVLSNGTIFFECPRCLLTYFFPDGSYMTNFTHFKGVFDTALKIEWLDMFTYSFVPGVEWASLETKLSDPKISAEIFEKLSSANSKTSTEPKKGSNSSKMVAAQPDLGSLQFQAMAKLRSQFKVFQNVSSFGIQEGFMRILQVNDVMSYLKNLKIYQKCGGIKSPVETLTSFVHHEASLLDENVTRVTGKPNSEYSNEHSQSHSSTNNFGNNSSGSTGTSKRRRFSSALSPLTSSEQTEYQDKDQSNYKKTKY